MATNGCWVHFWRQDNCDGDDAYYAGPAHQYNLNDNKWDHGSGNENRAYSSLQIGENTWLIVYDEDGLKGAQHLFRPLVPGQQGLTVNDLDTVSRPGGDDYNWDRDIQSWELFDHPMYDTGRILDIFRSSFEGEYNLNTNSQKITFHTQDAPFIVHDPQMSQDGEVLNFTLDLEHSKSTKNDYATATFGMDKTGNLVGTIRVSYTMSSAEAVPDWAIEMADVAIDAGEEALKLIVDLSEEAITEGLGTAAVPIINKTIEYSAEALTFIVDHINALSKAIFILEENGGTVYFPSMVAHSIHRLMTAFVQTNAELGDSAQAPTTATMSFDHDGLPGRLPGGDDSWQSGEHADQYCMFWNTIDGDTDNYRVWGPQVSYGYGGTGLFVACKIDNMLTTKDDHMALNVAFDAAGNIIALQGSLFYHRSSGDSFQQPSSGLIAWSNTENENGDRQLVQLTTDTDGNRITTSLSGTSINDAYLACFNASVTACETADGVNFDPGTENLPQVSVSVIEALQQSAGIAD